MKPKNRGKGKGAHEDEYAAIWGPDGLRVWSSELPPPSTKKDIVEAAERLVNRELREMSTPVERRSKSDRVVILRNGTTKANAFLSNGCKPREKGLITAFPAEVEEAIKRLTRSAVPKEALPEWGLRMSALRTLVNEISIPDTATA